jgi:hypothetical protein
LKRLRGTPIIRHDQNWQMVYGAQPPYEILQNKLIDFAVMQKMRRFARFWDLIGNSGNFVETTPLLWKKCNSPFAGFMQFTEWSYAKLGRRHQIALESLAESLFHFLTDELGLEKNQTAQIIWNDWKRGGRHEKPAFLQDYISNEEVKLARDRSVSPKRQARHFAKS